MADDHAKITSKNQYSTDEYCLSSSMLAKLRAIFHVRLANSFSISRSVVVLFCTANLIMRSHAHQKFMIE
ncbi:hypothetical protein [Photobacterium gaetbulicola]|uniref:hypothetical protein n=1 Tax=Photobacterium gaetbulicola TaxID=1295392 RepID=UPI0012E00CEE|nr:hypothetical protein [Photobacterium gaetbulicola]